MEWDGVTGLDDAHPTPPSVRAWNMRSRNMKGRPWANLPAETVDRS
jgi:hypothetical protein